MTIKRELKDWIWDFDEETYEITIWEKHEGEPPAIPVLTLDMIRWFSLFRFLIRCSQRLRIAEAKKWRSKIEAKYGK